MYNPIEHHNGCPINPEMIHPVQFVLAAEAAGLQPFDAFHPDQDVPNHCVGLAIQTEDMSTFAMRMLYELVDAVPELDDVRAIKETTKMLIATIDNMVESDLRYLNHKIGKVLLFPALPWPTRY